MLGKYTRLINSEDLVNRWVEFNLDYCYWSGLEAFYYINQLIEKFSTCLAVSFAVSFTS